MKNFRRILAVLLALTCLLTLVACKKGDKKKKGDDTEATGNGPVAPAASVEYVSYVLNSSHPTKSETTTTTNVTFLGKALTLTGKETLRVAQNGYSRYDATLERLSDYDGEKPVTTQTVLEYCDAGGKVYDAETSEWKAQRPSSENTLKVVNLAAANGTVTEQDGGYLFSASVPASKSGDVLGVSVAATGNITITVFVIDGVVDTITVAFPIEGGDTSATTVCTYATETFSHP